MPRIGRFTVEFMIPSDPKVWVAEFSHKHAKESCPHQPLHTYASCRHFDSKGRPQHLSAGTCSHPTVVMRCPAPKVIPVAYQIDHGNDIGKVIPVQHVTSVKLRYKGQPVFLSGSAPCSLHDEYNWRQGLHYAMQRALEKAGYCKLEKINGKLVVTAKKPIYDDIMRSFWLEMGIKAPATTTTALVAVNSTPRENMHGLGHTGAD
jgi:hypothetical protein